MLDITEIYRGNPEHIALRWFRTASPAHPGVARLLAQGEWFIAGAVTLIIDRPSLFQEYELTPRQSRFIFAHKGWSKVVGFHGRNVIHHAHEHIQLEALRQTNADGLFLNPVIGPKKPGDFLPNPIIKSYQMTLDFGIYPSGKALLGSLAVYPRYCGPREAVFSALCRKNMGCSHFIVGRDHAGVGDFYQPDEYSELFDKLGDIGIIPVFFDAIGYNPKTKCYQNTNHEDVLPISGTAVRDALQSGKTLPDWYIRDMIQEMLTAAIKSGQPVFHE